MTHIKQDKERYKKLTKIGGDYKEEFDIMMKTVGKKIKKLGPVGAKEVIFSLANYLEDEL